MRYFIFSFLIFYFSSNAQTGIVNYGEVQSMQMGAPIGPDYNAMLVFDKNNSLYVTRKDSLEGEQIKEQKSFQSNSGQNHSITVATNQKGFQYYYEPNEKILFSRDLGFRYVKDKTIDIPWKIMEETKTIGDYQVQKATAHFRGRDYTAWFTPEIPLPYGPWKLVGLPGLILEAYDTNKEIYWYFKNIEYPTKKQYLLKPIKNPNSFWLNFKDYKEFLLKVASQARTAGRMMSENMGASKSNFKDERLDNYIEAFTIEE